MGREITLTWLQFELHQKILDMRSIENTIQKDLFQRLWDASNKKQRLEVKGILLRGDKETLRLWMENHPDIDFGEMSVNQLRRIGRKLGITNYCRLDYNTLVQEIEAKNGKT